MFSGFSDKTSSFLWELSFNNERPWFLEHKDEFEQVLNTPFRELYAQTLEEMGKRFPGMTFEGHASRIYRDARRLYGRGPYKDHLWFTVWNSAVGKYGPAFWFEIGAAQFGCGMGFWTPGPEYMEAYRNMIAANPSRFERLALQMAQYPEFSIFGHEYKKPKGDLGPVINPWYNRKELGVENNQNFGGVLLTPEFPVWLTDEYAKLMPLYDFFTEVYLSVGPADLSEGRH